MCLLDVIKPKFLGAIFAGGIIALELRSMGTYFIKLKQNLLIFLAFDEVFALIFVYSQVPKKKKKLRGLIFQNSVRADELFLLEHVKAPVGSISWDDQVFAAISVFSGIRNIKQNPFVLLLSAL